MHRMSNMSQRGKNWQKPISSEKEEDYKCVS